MDADSFLDFWDSVKRNAIPILLFMVAVGLGITALVLLGAGLFDWTKP